MKDIRKMEEGAGGVWGGGGREWVQWVEKRERILLYIIVLCIIIHGLSTKREIKLAGRQWPSSFHCMFIERDEVNLSNIAPSWSNKLGQERNCHVVDTIDIWRMGAGQSRAVTGQSWAIGESSSLPARLANHVGILRIDNSSLIPGEGTQQSFIRGGSSPRSKPLPVYTPYLI